MAHVNDAHKKGSVRHANSSIRVEKLHTVRRWQWRRALFGAQNLNKITINYFKFKKITSAHHFSASCDGGSSGHETTNENLDEFELTEITNFLDLPLLG